MACYFLVKLIYFISESICIAHLAVWHEVIIALLIVVFAGLMFALLSLFLLYITVGGVCGRGQPRAATGHAVDLGTVTLIKGGASGWRPRLRLRQLLFIAGNLADTYSQVVKKVL